MTIILLENEQVGVWLTPADLWRHYDPKKAVGLPNLYMFNLNPFSPYQFDRVFYTHQEKEFELRVGLPSLSVTLPPHRPLLLGLVTLKQLHRFYENLSN